MRARRDLKREQVCQRSQLELWLEAGNIARKRSGSSQLRAPDGLEYIIVGERDVMVQRRDIMLLCVAAVYMLFQVEQILLRAKTKQ